MNFHQPVLINKVIEYLNVGPDKTYIDACLGGGGHTEKILQLGARVLGIDQDADAFKFVSRRLQTVYKDKLILALDNFVNMDKIIARENIKKVDGVLFDLGTSRFQLLSTSRGFSYTHDSRLDMRMNKKALLSAFEVINSYSLQELADLFVRFGEEEFAQSIAQNIIKSRKVAPLVTTHQLANIVKNVYNEHHSRSLKYPEAKIFQAIRIEVNNELEVLKVGLEKALNCLAPQGRVVALTYHSLEDRIVKKFFFHPKLINLTRKPILADYKERRNNPSARSAKLRAAALK